MKKIISVIICMSVLVVGMVSCDKDDDIVKEEPVVVPDEPKEEPSDEPKDEPDDPQEETRVDLAHSPAKMTIETENHVAINSKDKADYRNCTIVIESDSAEFCLDTTGRIRGRGNSSWLWYPKKPYRIKLDSKTEVMGLKKNKDWVLLANYRDATDMMNTFVFIMGQMTGRLPYTNHVRYVDVTLNGEYIGLYQLTEQVEQGSGRVDIDKKEGMLLSLDVDDGPAESPYEPDNFWSDVYRMPVCVKYPEDGEGLDKARTELAKLETAIQNGNYEEFASLLDVGSMIDYLIIQELVYNVELDAPRSMYMHRDKGGLWTMGPLWDFDAGYDFDWTNMTVSHNFFTDYKELVMGTKPATHTGTQYRIPGFFSDLFKNAQFVSEYKSRWKELSPRILSEAWAETKLWSDGCADALDTDAATWPIGKDWRKETEKMEKWLSNRIIYLNNVIMNY